MNNPKVYQATQSADELIIHDFEVFCECSRHGVDFDSKWIKAAAAEAKIGQDDGHAMPLNIRHHPLPGEKEIEPVMIGYAEVTSVAPISFRGREVMAIITDLHIKKEEYFEKVSKGHFPYRSVEIFDRDKPKIDCLSLLDHEPPFLELPMLMAVDIQRFSRKVANATIAVEYDASAEDCDNPVIASFAVGPRMHLFSRIDGEVQMTGSAKTPTMEAIRMQSEGEEKEKEKKPDDEKRENMEDGQGGGGPDVAAVVKAIESGEISIADFAEIQKAMEAAQAGTTEEPEEEEPAPAAVPGMESMKGKMSPEMARMQGQIKALETQLANRDEEESIRKDVDEAWKRLEGRIGGENPRADLEQFRRDHGSKAFKSYADTLCGQLAVIPDKRSIRMASSAPPSKIPEELQKKFKDPGDLEMLGRFCNEYHFSRKNGFARQPIEKWVTLRMERAKSNEEGGEE